MLILSDSHSGQHLFFLVLPADIAKHVYFVHAVLIYVGKHTHSINGESGAPQGPILTHPAQMQVCSPPSLTEAAIIKT